MKGETGFENMGVWPPEIEMAVWPAGVEDCSTSWRLGCPNTCLEIEVAAFYAEGYGCTCAGIVINRDRSVAHNQVHGAGRTQYEPA